MGRERRRSATWSSDLRQGRRGGVESKSDAQTEKHNGDGAGDFPDRQIPLTLAPNKSEWYWFYFAYFSTINVFESIIGVLLNMFVILDSEH